MVGVWANYGENLWNFNFAIPPNVQVGQPQYGALVTLRWDIFTGFGRLNQLRAAESNRDAASARLQSSEIQTSAEVWRAYYAVESARSKYAYSQSLVGASHGTDNANIETYPQGLT